MSQSAAILAQPLLLRISDVLRTTGMRRSTLYSYMSKGKFPKPVKIGEKAVAWRSDDVTEWVESL